MENREFDIFTDMLANPTLTLELLSNVGMKASNTSLQSREKYKNNEWVKEQFTDALGNFDDNKFNKFYDNAKLTYNKLAVEELSTSLSDEPIWHRDNIFVNPEKTNKGPEFKDALSSNPYLLTSSLIRLGEIGDRVLSIDELAQLNLVLLNPQEAEKDPSKARWGGDPNHNFWEYFGDTLVLALYDEAGTHKDPLTLKDTPHEKGAPKLNADGNFYYERLNGRDVHDRRVLNKMNVLTIDGSWANRHLDFFDSDDLDLKSVGGAIMKNAALVGSMWIPGIGPWIIGASIASQLVGLLGTLGKMASGSNNALFNNMEGWSKSVSRLASTEYSQQHMLSTENLINLVGDTMGLLAEQRFLFKTLPSVLGKSNITTEAGEAKKYELLLAALKEYNAKAVLEVLSSDKDAKRIMQTVENLSNENVIRSQVNTALDAYAKDYYKVGAVLSKGYMTAITVADTYGDAKAAGASDMEATLLTLGHAIGEYAILSTGLGELILPELRASARRQEAIANGLTKLARESFGKAEEAGSKLARHNYAQKLMDLGKDIASGKYVTTSRSLQSVGAAALGESFEEVSEELLSDFSKGCYDVVKWLQGDSTRINTFGYDFTTGEFDTKEVLSRYGMNALGGFIGGGLANAMTDFREMTNINKMSSESAILQLIYMDRNGQTKDFLKNLNKMNLGNKHLSTRFTVSEDGVKSYMPGTDEDNLDKFIKDAVRKQVQMIHEILHANGADISDNEFISKNTFEDMRFHALLKSVTADNFITEFNTKIKEVVQISNELEDAIKSNKDTNKDGVVEDREDRNAEKAKDNDDISPQAKKNIEDLRKQLTEALKELLEFTNGDKAYDFIAESLFEMTTELSGIFDTVTFSAYAEKESGLKFNLIPSKQLKNLREQFLTFKAKNLKERVRYISSAFRAMAELSSAVIQKHAAEYENLAKEVSDIEQAIRNFNVIPGNEETDLGLFMEGAKNLADLVATYTNFEAYMVGMYGSTEEKENYQLLMLQKSEGNELELETLDTLRGRKMREIALPIILNNIEQFITPIINRGYAAEETKHRLTQFLNYTTSMFEAAKQTEIMADLRNTTEISKRYKPVFDALGVYKNKISRLDNSPFEKSYNEFSISVGAQTKNISELIRELNKRLSETADDVSLFRLDSTLGQELKYAIYTLLMYKAAVMAARTDADAVSAYNIFGYNATLNEVAKKVTGEHPQLAEIDSKTADRLVIDINTNLSKLMSLQRLFNVNTGQKMSLLDRASANKDMLVYKHMKAIVTVKDDDELRNWVGFDEFKKTIDSLKVLAKMERGELSTTLKLEDKKTLLQEVITMENAVFDLFKANFGDFKNLSKTDMQKLKLFINPDRFTLYTNANELLNENLKALDGNSFIWIVAARAALRASDFYKEYAEVIDPEAENPIAPIATQETAIYNDYAHIVNGNVFSAFALAYRESVIEDFNSTERTDADRKKILLSLGYNDEIAEKLVNSEWRKYVINNLPVPKYHNIVLTEGIPGSGKTKGTLATLIKILKLKHQSVLDNAWVIHGVGQANAETLVNDLGMEIGDHCKAMDRLSFMREVDSTWTEYQKDPVTGEYILNNNDYTVNSDNEFVSNRPVNKPTKYPSIIIIDEVTHFTSYDLDLILRFCQQHGITCIVAGDYDQSGVTGTHPLKEVSGYWTMEPKRTNFVRSPKFGVSMRTDNSLKSRNQQLFLDYMHNPDGKCSLAYYEKENGIYGDRVYALNQDEHGNYDIYQSIEDNLESILDSIKIMKDTLRKEGKLEKIGYIYNDTNSPLYQELIKPEWEGIIELKPGLSAQGSESQYYIIDVNPFRFEHDEDSDNPDDGAFVNNMSVEDYARLLYTGITRSELGSILIVPEDYLGIKLEQQSSSYIISEPKNVEVIKKYATERKELLTELSGDGKEIAINERADTGDLLKLADNPKLEGGLNDGVDPQPDDDTKSGQTYNPPAQIDSNAPSEDQRKLAEKLAEENPTNVGDKLTIQITENGESITDVSVVASITNDKVVMEDGTEFSKDILLSEFGLPYKEGDATYTIIEHSARTVTVPAAPVSHLVEQTLITDDDLKSDKLLAEEIDKTNEEDPINNIRFNEATGEEEIDMLLHTHNTFETGVIFKDNGEITWDDYNEARIDSINGLLKFGRRNNVFAGNNRADFMDKLGYIRSLLLNTKDKVALETELSLYFAVPNVYVTFAYKSTARPSDKNIKEGRPYVSSNPEDGGIYEKNIGERTEFNGSSDPEASRWNNKSLVAIIGSLETGDIVEIPLAVLSSPWTLLKAKRRVNGKNEYIFKEVVDKYEKYRNDGMKKHDISVQLLKDFKGVKKYRQLMDIFELYDFTDNGIFFIDDPTFTLAGNCGLVGPTFSRTRGYYYDDDSKLKFDWNALTEAEWVDLAKFAQHKNATVSKGIYTSKDGILSGQHHKALKKGHSFVLYSNDLSLRTDEELFNQFKLQEQCKEEGKPYDNKVMVLYVMPPKTTFRNYIENLKTIVIDGRHKDAEHIGQPYTSYKILKILVSNPRFLDALEKRLPGKNVGLNLQNTIRKLISLEGDPESFRQEMYDTVTWEGYGDTPLRLHNLLNGVLLDSCYIARNITKEGHTYKLNEDMVNEIDRILKENGIDGIRRRLPIDHTSATVGDLIRVNVSDDYKIDGESIKIHGKVDSYIFHANMSNHISNWLKKRKPRNNKHLMTTDEDAYKAGRSIIIAPAEQRRVNPYLRQIDELKKKTGVDYTDIFNKNTKAIALSTIVNNINISGKHIAVVLDGKVLVIDVAGYRASFYSSKDNPVTDVTALKDNTGVAKFLLDLEDVSTGLVTHFYALIDPKDGFKRTEIVNTPPVEEVQEPLKDEDNGVKLIGIPGVTEADYVEWYKRLEKLSSTSTNTTVGKMFALASQSDYAKFIDAINNDNKGLVTNFKAVKAMLDRAKSVEKDPDNINMIEDILNIAENICKRREDPTCKLTIRVVL